MLQYLRIAVTVLSLTACVLLIALWVRSYWTWDRCYWPGKRLGVQINSDAGHVVLIVATQAPTSTGNSFMIAQLPSPGPTDAFYDDNILGFYFERSPSRLRLDIPFWFNVLASAALAAAPWLRERWRFSLRTLLIATTVVAVVLGIIAAVPT